MLLIRPQRKINKEKLKSYKQPELFQLSLKRR